ncbi:hypothetical protein TNCV_4838641 [Trichonephila clavipes]|nr:hypothetical protein TNCV_4838641 [Trichonephila clavipes]
MSLDLRFKTIFGRPLFHWTCPACHWSPVQHAIGPLSSMSFHLFSMSLDPRVKTIFGRPLFHWTCPACHWTPVQQVIGPVQHVIGPPFLKLFLIDLCFIGPVQPVIGPLSSRSLDLFSMSLDPRVKTVLGDLCFIGPVQHVICG